MNYNVNMILFDLGGVIINLDVNRTIESFKSNGISNIVNNTGHHYTNNIFYEFETGSVSKNDFLEELNSISNKNVNQNELVESWNAMILDIPKGKVDLLNELKSKYKLYLLSNTNSIHQQKFLSEFKSVYGYDFNQLFERSYYSHEIGYRKPDQESFEFVINDAGLIPNQTLFIDDSKDNISSADLLGFQTHHLPKPDLLYQLASRLL